ncbi:hypothetical protein IW262DRAFT_1418550 [Armillaria fumosa]|nr:hypothetical protein IW262DRAFT_1418550 [Armillaria fumosa]
MRFNCRISALFLNSVAFSSISNRYVSTYLVFTWRIFSISCVVTSATTYYGNGRNWT